ncbi:MAG TPA: HAD hydrolase family protein, partial [Candidatus Avacidaminococcus intestinavium]|nr:HAD hydrolase family protein [Candidatus Avacidaminococcus intestinavium]
WSAVSALAESKNIETKQTMCIGDSNNDFEMISSAGVGVAVANANNRIKNIARLLTTSNNENGVSVAIEKVLNYR